MPEEKHHVTDREIRDLRRLARMVADLDESRMLDMDALIAAMKLAKRCVSFGRSSRSEIMKNAREEALRRRSEQVSLRHQMLYKELDIIMEEFGPKASLDTICKALDARGVRPLGGGNWQPSSIRYVILGRKK